MITRFIKLDCGEYLYDEKSLKVYTFYKPHKFIGYLNLKDFSIDSNSNVLIQVQ